MRKAIVGFFRALHSELEKKRGKESVFDKQEWMKTSYFFLSFFFQFIVESKTTSTVEKNNYICILFPFLDINISVLKNKKCLKS
jgi:hypothetical protein